MALALPALLLLHALGAAANVTYCWGSGIAGQLGDGQGGGSHSQPVPVAVASAPELATVAAGTQHTCGLTAAGQAYCWGQAVNGELGVGPINAATAYLALPAPVAGNLTFTELSLGDEFTCGIAGSKAYCWGSGESGRLGTGGNTSSDVPVEVAGGHTFASIALGQAHACALTPEGQAWCWGENFFGQLGDNSTASSGVPVPVAGNFTFVDIAAGEHHTCALLAPSRETVCWGSNAMGQLGTNGTTIVAAPAAGAGLQLYFASLTAGAEFTCGTSSQATSTRCWGNNSRGQLGSRPFLSTDFSSAPVLVPGTQRFALISAGEAHACGVDARATAYCWGDGAVGQLGTGLQGRANQDGDYTSNTPLPVAGTDGGLLPFYSVSAGGRHTCGVSARSAAAVLSPSTPPSPSPSPAGEGSSAPAPLPPPSASSFPVGAVVGAVAGAAVLAVLAFFALRPGKGWLRKRGAPAVKLPPSAKQPPAAWRSVPAAALDAEKGSADRSDSSLALSLKGKGSPVVLPDGVQHTPPPSAAPPGQQAGLVQQAEGTQQAEFAQRAQRAQQAPAILPGSTHADADGDDSLRDDPLLKYISTYLSSHSRSPPWSLPTSSGFGSSGSGGGLSYDASGSSEAHSLPPEAHLWQLQWEELDIKRAIGRGSCGAVYLARWHETTVAVKVLLDTGAAARRRGLLLPEDTMRELQAEAAVMIRMRHPNVVQFMGLCQLPPALVTEYCARGSLYDCLQAGNASLAAAAELTWARRLALAIDAGTGLLYLHSRNIVHRDVKSPNYLVADHWGLKIGDFNLSRLLAESGPSMLSAGVTNPIWLAPELMRGGHATTASDVFSFGVVLWELLTWRLPWAGSGLSPFQIGAKVVAGERLEVPPREALPGPDTATFGGLDAYCELLQECWAGQPQRRPGMAQVVRRLRALLEVCGIG